MGRVRCANMLKECLAITPTQCKNLEYCTLTSTITPMHNENTLHVHNNPPDMLASIPTTSHYIDVSVDEP